MDYTCTESPGSLLLVYTDKPKPRIKHHWEPHKYETDEIADMFDTPEGIRTLHEFSSNGLYLELTRRVHRDYDIPTDY